MDVHFVSRHTLVVPIGWPLTIWFFYTAAMEEIQNSSISNDIIKDSLPVPPPPIPPSPWRNVFLGPNGIRAGWRVLMFAAIIVGLVTLIHFLRGAHPPRNRTLDAPGPTILGEWLSFAIVAFAALVMSRIEKQPWGNYGLPLRNAFRSRFWIGGLFGFVALSCLMGSLRLAHCFYIDSVALHGIEVWKYAGLWLVGFVGVGFAEEFTVRGYLQYTFASGMGFWPAAVLTSALFMLGHIKNPGETFLGLTDVFLFGILACFMWWRTGDMWLAVGFHALWDWGLSFFYSVADSGIPAMGHLFNSRVQGPSWLGGGTAGPEGSAINLFFDLVYFVIIAVAFPRREFVGWKNRGVSAPIVVPAQDSTIAG